MKGFAILLVGALAQSWNLIFNDKFNNLNNWVPEVKSGQASGNNEWEFYTDRPVNVAANMTSRGQALVIRAQAENFMGYQFTSGRVHSAQTFGPYGFFNVQALVPKGTAIWPAIWMMAWEAYNVYGGWASCGEIDIMETVCQDTSAYSTLHFGGFWPNNVQYPNYPNNKYQFTVDWTQPHWFGYLWTATEMTFYMDAQMVNGQITGGQLIQTIPSSVWWSEDLNGNRYPGNAPFDQPVNFIINIAVGGTWPCSFPGCCDGATVPAVMEVYNVQVWQQTSGETEEEV